MFELPDELKSTAHSKVEVVHLGDRTFSRYTFFPGFRWSTEVKPLLQRDWCPFEHHAIQVSGRIRLRFRDGSEVEAGPGEAQVIPPEHDGWVVGDEPAVCYSIEPRTR